jgi:flagellar hook assembly protein FlgD
VEGQSPPVYRNVLRQNAPNPFNPHTEIAFELAKAGRTALRIYDARGRLVSTLLDATLPAGPHHAIWNGITDQSGRDVASGVYFYRLDAPGFHESRRMVLTR